MGCIAREWSIDVPQSPIVLQERPGMGKSKLAKLASRLERTYDGCLDYFWVSATTSKADLTTSLFASLLATIPALEMYLYAQQRKPALPSSSSTLSSDFTTTSNHLHSVGTALNTYLPRWYLNPSPEALLCSSLFFAIVTSTLYRYRERDKYQDAFLILGVIVGSILGSARGYTLQDIILSMIPWSVILSLWTSSLVHDMMRLSDKRVTATVLQDTSKGKTDSCPAVLRQAFITSAGPERIVPSRCVPAPLKAHAHDKLIAEVCRDAKRSNTDDTVSQGSLAEMDDERFSKKEVFKEPGHVQDETTEPSERTEQP